MLVPLVIQVGHGAVMGVLFAYLITIIGSKYIVFKAATFGTMVWFIIFSVGSLFKLPVYNISWMAVASNLFTSAMWGVTCAQVWFGLSNTPGIFKKVAIPPRY